MNASVTSTEISGKLSTTTPIPGGQPERDGPTLEQAYSYVKASENQISKKQFEEYLIRHAKQAVWCSPYEDKQYIFDLSRITKPGGGVNNVLLFKRRVNLPDTKNTYHVFMIGGNFAVNFGFPDYQEHWIPLEYWANITEFTFRVYNQYGQLVPTDCVYMAKEFDDTLLIAIKDVGQLGMDLGKEPVYMHLRDGHHWTSKENSRKQQPYIFNVESTTLKQDEKTFELARLTMAQVPSQIKTKYHNGALVNHITWAKPDDYVEAQVDHGILFTEYHRVDDLPTYQSTLDSLNKYLLMLYDRRWGYSDTLRPEDYPHLVHYRDDIELFLVRIDTLPDGTVLEQQGQDETKTRPFEETIISKSAYYPRNRENSLRHVAHQAYGLPVDYVHGLIRHLDETMDLSRWYIKVVVKASAVKRYLINEHNQLINLWLQPREERLRVMTSTTTDLPFWKARELEHSPYFYLMRAYEEELTADKILKAYGYNQTALALANPNVSLSKQGDMKYFVLPVGLIEKATIFEYDQEGTLLGYYHHVGGTGYLPVNENTVFIEAFAGFGSSVPSVYKNPAYVEVNPQVNYRVYRQTYNEENRILKPYTDITKQIGLDRPTTNIVNIPRKDNESIIVMSDESFLCCTETVDRKELGYYRVGVVMQSARGRLPVLMEIPFERIDVWVNGRALVRGIDYHIQRGYIVIVSKKGIPEDSSETSIEVTYRCMGFPYQSKGQLGYRPVNDRGFVIEGLVSRDHNYEVHAHRVAQMTVDGGVYNPAGFTFNEFGEARTTVPDGSPYSIDRHYIALKGFGGEDDAYEAIEQDRDKTERIQAYLRETLQTTRTLPDITTVRERYPLYSPFLSAIVTRILKDPSRYLQMDYNNKAKVARLVSDYQFLLEADPANIGYDEDFIIVHPLVQKLNDPIDVHYRIYALIEQIAKQFLKHPVEIEPWFKVTRTRG